MKKWLFLCCFLSIQLAYGMDTVRVAKNEILILNDTIFAPSRDTLFVVGDNYKIRKNPYQNSREFYQKLKEKSGQNKITAKIFDLLYVNNEIGFENKPTKNSKSSHSRFEPYDGYEITNIRIKYVDVIEGSVNDTSRVASSGIALLANKLQIKTWRRVIRNNLIIKKGASLNPYTLADNERILRNLRYIEDARIYVSPDKFDVAAELIIVIKERFSWGADLTLDGVNNYSFNVINRNIAGLGVFATGSYLYQSNYENPHGYDVAIGGQNIDNTITSWELSHVNHSNQESWNAGLQKEFLSPDIKYGGGIMLRSTKDSTLTLDGEIDQSSYSHLISEDIWLGRSWKLPAKTKRTNLILTARFLNRAFNERPFVSTDSNSLFHERKILLGGINLAQQTFLKSNYIASFGISEDIPIGYRISIVGGRDFGEFTDQNYFGMQLFWATYIHNFGFLQIDQEIGSFFKTFWSNGVYSAKVSYFSPLITSGRSKIRNYAEFSLVSGIDQDLSKGISLERRIRDLPNDPVMGNGTFSFKGESVIYTPWYFYGFRFAPFAYFNMGQIWDYRNGRRDDETYSGIGGGIRIKNESLVINTFELRVTQFLDLPGNEDTFVFSLRSTVPIGFGNIFRFKPQLIPFR